MVRWLEESVPMSQSVLWDLVREYYEDRGPDAWSSADVPTQATTNCHMAEAYAATVLAWAEALTPSDEPVYVLELGAGTGRLGARVAMALQRQRLRTSPAVVVVITDLSRKNIDACKQHPTMQPLIAAGAVDFALLDLEQPGPPRLELRDEELSATAPLALLANYIVDSVRQDAFRFRDGAAHELWVRAGIPEGGAVADVKLDIKPVPLGDSHYADPVFDDLLRVYAEQLEDGDVFIPTPFLRTLRPLVADRETLFLCADKGHRYVPEWEGQPPAVVAHGSISVTANLHAVAHMFEAMGGHAWHADSADTSFTISACLLTQQAGVEEHVTRAYAHWLNDYGPADFERLGDALPEPSELSVELMLSLIRLSHYDSSTFAMLADTLPDLVDEATDVQREDLLAAMPKIWERHYRIDTHECVAFHLGRTYMELDLAELALPFLESSLVDDGPDFAVHYNLALCLEELGRDADAVTHLHLAQAFSPDDEEVFVRLQELADKRAESA
ncbi:MAG: hypothetical protein KC912_08590 [Proteobacteria bacterium]|nr:hypothetical protein [Pseudomonadota bacterium]